MDAEGGQALLVEDADPESCEGEIHKREEEINPRKDGSAGREVVADVALSVEIIHGRFNVHGHFELRRVAVGKDEVVLIGVGFFFVERAERVLAVERIEGVDGLDQIGLKGAPNLAILQLLEDMEPGIQGAEEESHLGEVQIGIGE